VAYLCANFSLPRPLCCRLRPDVRDRQASDVRQTSDLRRASSLNASALWGAGHNKCLLTYLLTVYVYKSKSKKAHVKRSGGMLSSHSYTVNPREYYYCPQVVTHNCNALRCDCDIDRRATTVRLTFNTRKSRVGRIAVVISANLQSITRWAPDLQLPSKTQSITALKGEVDRPCSTRERMGGGGNSLL